MIDQDKLQKALQNRYTLLGVLGEGSLGTVYRARDLDLERLVAIKVLNVNDISARERFLDEIVAVRHLHHPNIISFYEANTVEEILYYVQEYVEGESLDVLLERVGRLPVEQAIAVAEAVASALEYAHRQRILHRDVKPANILIPRGARMPEFSGAKLVDFGVVGLLQVTTQTTVSGQIFGTPQYMSPEQLLGEPQDERTDVYGLGALLFTMVIGYPPFGEDKASNTNQLQQLHRIISEPVVVPSSLPPPIISFLTRALSKRSEDRPTNIVQEIQFIRHTVNGGQALDAPTKAAAPFRGTLSWAKWLFSAALLIGLFGLLWITNSWEWWVGLTRRKMLGILGGILLIIGGFTVGFYFRKWILTLKSRVDVDVNQVLTGAKSRVDLSQTLAIEVEAIFKRCQALDERFLGKTIAIMVNEYEQATNFNDRQIALSKSVEFLDKLMTRLSPWYIKYEKLLTFIVSSVGIVSGIFTIMETISKL